MKLRGGPWAAALLDMGSARWTVTGMTKGFYGSCRKSRNIQIRIRCAPSCSPLLQFASLHRLCAKDITADGVCQGGFG